jgi:hypothetical protein
MLHGEVVRVEACELRVGREKWPWAVSNADAIALNWQLQQIRNPSYFNGGIQILTGYRAEGAVFHGMFAATDFASYLHWRGERYPDDSVRDCFGCAILRSAEGHLLLGRQAAGNLNADRAYCPGGFIDPADVGNGMIDIDGSVTREIVEETGLDVAKLERTPGYLIIAADASIAIGIEYRSELSSALLRAQIMQHIQRETKPELEDVLIVRATADVRLLKTSGYVTPLAEHLFGRDYPSGR